MPHGNGIRSSPPRIVLYGAGRWARNILCELHALVPSTTRFVIVTKSQSDAISAWAAEHLPCRLISVASTVPPEEQGDRAAKTLGIVAGRACHNADAAFAFLKNGWPTAVEKPLALSAGTLDDLIRAAQQHQALLWPLLVFDHNPYLVAVAEHLRGEPLASIKIDWSDPAIEVRDGEVKRFDPAISVVQDVSPHIWSVARHFVPNFALHSVRAVTATAMQATLELVLSNGLALTANLARHAEHRQRLLALKFGDGRVCEVDFDMPGASWSIDGHPREWPAAVSVAQDPGPISKSLFEFLTLAKAPFPDTRKSGIVRARAVSEFVFACQDAYARGLNRNPNPSSHLR